MRRVHLASLARMVDLQKFQRACQVFLAQLLTVHDKDAPNELRRMGDELDRLAETNV